MQLVCLNEMVVARYDDTVTVPISAFPGAEIKSFAGSESDLPRIGKAPDAGQPDDRPFGIPDGAGQRTIYAPREFMALFTQAEQQKLFKARSDQTNPDLAVQVDMFITMAMAGMVDLTNAEVIADVNECVTAGLITADRAKAILAGQAPTS